MAGLALPCVGLAGWILMANDRRKYRNSLAAAQQADALGLHFAEKPDAALLKDLNSFRLFADADKHFADNCCTGEVAGMRIAVLEYATAYRRTSNFYSNVGKILTLVDHYTTALKKGTAPLYGTLNNQTIVVVFGATGVPDMRVGPRGWLDAVAKFHGEQITRLPGEAEFDKHFSVWAEKPEEIVDYLSPHLIGLLLESEKATVEVHQGLLTYFHHRQVVEPQDYEGMIQEALAIARALQHQDS